MKNLFVLLLLLMSVVFMGCNKAPTGVSEAQAKSYNIQKAIELSFMQAPTVESEGEFKNGDIIILKFSADWCGPCHTLDRIIDNSEAIKKHFKEKTKGYWIIDIESNDPNDQKWVNIARPTSIPLVVKYTYQDGKWKEVKRFVGVRSEQQILGWLQG